MAQTGGANHRLRCEQLLHEAEAFEQVEDWDNAVAKYRELNELDHLFQGAESKLLFAVRERECDRNYKEGKARMAAGDYPAAAAAFHKAKARGGVYKDTTALIRECEQKMGTQNAATPQPVGTTRKGCLGVLMLLR